MIGMSQESTSPDAISSHANCDVAPDVMGLVEPNLMHAPYQKMDMICQEEINQCATFA